ncbi:hypothetical protein FRC12_023820 [Ceratobasidium sp. 428]|nr:hypothetical protein FRC12_023820 [Ceratobasidium sp. 428]
MSNVYSEALEAWKTAHAQFKTALKAYSDACSTFCASCSGALVQNTTQSMLEDVLAALESELPGLASDVEQVKSADRAVKLLRNKSTTLVQINILPAELLTRIFESLCYSREILGEMDQLSKSLWALAWVNTYWRQLAFSNSYLWARIHMPTWDKRRGKPHEQAQAQLTYARDLPLDVMLDSTKQRTAFMSHRATEDLFREVAPRLRSLTYHSGRSTSYSPSDVLSGWIQHGTPVVGCCLKLQSYRLQSGDLRLQIQSVSTPMERIEAFLAPVEYLALRNHCIGWSSALYHRLIELDLSFDPGFVQFFTVTEFAAILSASPCLRSLKLRGLGLRPQDALDAVEPVRLDYLEVLFLGDIHRSSLRLLLPMFQPGSTPLYVRFDLPKRNVDIVHYVQLLQRINTMKLMIVGSEHHLPQSLLAFLAGVQYLCLCNFVLDMSFWVSMREPVILHANEQYPSVWPNLQILHLYECNFRISESKSDLKEPTPYNFMLWIWDGEQSDECPSAQTVLDLFSGYVPGIQEVQGDESILLEAWGTALDFAPYSK